MSTLTKQLQQKLDFIRSERNFIPKDFIDPRTDEFLRYLKVHNIKVVVLSVSGGVDSACVLGLLKTAQNKANNIDDHPFNIKNSGRIIALAQPIYSTPSIQERAYQVCEKFGIEIKTICQDKIYIDLNKIITKEFGEPLTNFASSMLKSYMRTPTAYAIASSYGGVVIGTGNLDEDGYLYYYCKFGDGAVDIGLIWDLHKSQVFQLAKYLDVPESILTAPPSADLYSDQTDEEEIGISYDSIELIYTYLVVFDDYEREKFKEDLDQKSLEQFEHDKEIVIKIHNKGLHKADLNPKNIGSHEF